VTRMINPKNDKSISKNVTEMDGGFLDNANLTFQSRANGYDSDAAIVDALKNDPDVAVVDSSALSANAGFSGDEQLTIPALPDKGSFDAPTLTVYPSAGQTKTVKVIGVIDQKISSLAGVFVGPVTGQQMFPKPGATSTSYFIKLEDGASAKTVADNVERALIANGAQGVDIEQELKDNQRQSQSFLYILQGFMGLGLIVGVAAVGVIAYRAIVERRQQIGMLRALGFQRSVISQAFVMESAIVVVIGVVAGAIFGLALSYNLMTSDDFTNGADAPSFIIPWPTMIVVLVASVVAALLMAWVPARQASRVVPAEALRYE
ncbi:MAG TPA: FtsX-like permease family protein, partial [Thermomicrobiales bacterium]|nr:FtsX-like permease family protein [Thermomicrobiales bacterium]